MNSLKKSMSVVLPNYNGKHLMQQYIPSIIEALNFSNVEFEFIVIDDFSTDDSIEFIQNDYPEITLLKNTENQGFSITCNKGINKATKELVFLLNSDVKLTQNYFEEQWKYFSSENTFGVMGCIMNFDGEKIEDSARFPRYKLSKFKANTFYYSLKKEDEIMTTYLSGANALVNRKKLLRLKGFDDIFSPFYFEDFDLGLRAWKMGWKSYYEHSSICYHRVSASTSGTNKSNSVKIIYNRNSFILQSIHLNGIRRIGWFIQLFTIVFTSHILKGEFWIFKSLNEFIKKTSQIEQSRDNIKNLQQVVGSNKSLNDIIRTIKLSIQNKNIQWL